MKNEITVCAIGGDNRLYHAIKKLSQSGYKTCVFALKLPEDVKDITVCNNLSQALEANVLLFGLPLSKDLTYLNAPGISGVIPLKEITQGLQKGHIVVGGQLTEAFTKELIYKDISYYDYYTNEVLTVQNALLTAEGVSSLLLNELPIAIHGMKIAITGFGRIGFLTAVLLKSMGAEPTVFARSALQLNKARLFGCKADNLSDFSAHIRTFDALINTVPAVIITKDELKVLNRDCYLLETASKPYGICQQDAAELGFRYTLAPGLPGKTAPKTAGELIAKAVDSYLKEVIV